MNNVRTPVEIPGLAGLPGALLVAIASCLLFSCSQEAPTVSETVRAVRTVTVSEPASGRARRFSGVVEASDSSSISFEVSGIVNQIEVEVGDRITEGQVLAIMDDSAYRLNVEAAQAAVSRAEVEFADAESAYDRLQRFHAMDGAISERALEQAEAARNSARQTLSYATSRLRLAERDLDRTVLRSPFPGVVAERHVDAFQTVGSGRPILDLFMEGAMEVAISVPESEIGDVYLGLPGSIRFPAIPDRSYNGIVNEISEVAGTANSFPVRVLIDSDNPRIRPGVTAEVVLVLGDEEAPRAYLLPISALGARSDAEGAFVFRFDPSTSTVARVSVTPGDIRDNDVAVSEGIAPGDIIVTAGVSFLRDGQEVRLMDSLQ